MKSTHNKWVHKSIQWQKEEKGGLSIGKQLYVNVHMYVDMCSSHKKLLKWHYHLLCIVVALEWSTG